MIEENTKKFDVEKAKIAKQQKIEWAKENLSPVDNDDLKHWRELAKKYSFRLPPSYQPGTETKYIKRLLKQHNVEASFYLQEVCGVSTFKELASLNPCYPALVEVGFALEYVDGTIMD